MTHPSSSEGHSLLSSVSSDRWAEQRCSCGLAFEAEGEGALARSRALFEAHKGAPGEQRGETPSDLCEICFKDVAGCICKPPQPLTQEARPLPARIEQGTWEDLRCVELSPGEWSVLHGNDPERPGYAIIEPGQSSPEAAWKVVALKLEAQLSRQESAEDAWKRGWMLGVKEGIGHPVSESLVEKLVPPYAPPISSDKEGQ